MFSYLKAYCSYVPIFLRFKTSYERCFLVFGVPNAKYLAFDTPDEITLTLLLTVQGD